MKIGVIGTGAVGTACAFATVIRGFASEVVLIDLDRKRARGLVTDLQYWRGFIAGGNVSRRRLRRLGRRGPGYDHRRHQ